MFCRLWAFVWLVPLISASQCPGPNWRYRSGSSYCYLFSTATSNAVLPYASAQNQCMSGGGHLVNFEDWEEFVYLSSRFGSNPKAATEYWIGLSYATDQWKWDEPSAPFVQGSLNTFNPDTVSADFVSETTTWRMEYRGVISHQTDGNVRLGVSSAIDSFSGSVPVNKRYICKAPFSSRPLCKTDEGWDFVAGRCWKPMTVLADYGTAAQTCSAEGAHISVPNSAEENNRLNQLAAEFSVPATWMGLNVIKTTETVPSLISWADNTNFMNSTYETLWLPLSPEAIITSLKIGAEYCGSSVRPVGLSSAKWLLEANCNDKKPYYCESETSKCPYGWTHFSGFCYQFTFAGDDIKTYQMASAECSAKGANLVVIYDQFVQGFLQNHIAALGVSSNQEPNFWIGYNSNGISSNAGKFRWVAAEGVTSTSYTNWRDGVTPLSSLTRCAFLQADQHQGTAPWAASQCDELLGFVCQALPEKVVQSNIVRPELRCEFPFTRYHEGCFSVSQVAANWDKAVQDCRRLNSSLVEIETGGENNHLFVEIGDKETWIGVRRRLFAEGSSQYFSQYSDGRNLTAQSYTNYVNGLSNEDHKFCVFMHPYFHVAEAGRWDVDDCTKEKRFICHHRGEPTGQEEPAEHNSPECGVGWKLAGTHCYKFVPDLVNQKLALQICQNQADDASLLFISSYEEAQDLRKMDLNSTVFESTDTFWIALQVESPNQWHWQYRNHTYKWTKPMGYTNWGTNQPTAAFSGNTSPVCGFLHADQLLEWEAGSCNALRPYICKKRANVMSPIVPLPSPAPTNHTFGCPPNWTKFGEQCFQRNDTYLDWRDAMAACQLFGADLATLNSAEQHQVQLHLLNGAWIDMDSLMYSMGPRQFLEKGGKYPKHTPWAFQIGRPEAPNGATNANCVAALGLDSSDFAKSLTIGQYSCAETRPFVCMLPLVSFVTPSIECIKPPEDRGCLRWGYGHRGSCFYMGVDPGNALGVRDQFDFDGARRFCAEYYSGDLAVINSRDKLSFLSVLLTTWASDYWIGLRENGNAWQAFSTWINNETLAIASWAYKQPSREHQGRGCVAVHGTRSTHDHNLPGDWYVTGCHEEKFALCEAPRQGWTNLPVLPTPFPSGCPHGWISPGDTSKNCYKAFYVQNTPAGGPLGTTGLVALNLKLTWQQAEDSCSDYGGHLASVSTQAEQDHIIRTVIPAKPTGYHYWIGLTENADWSGWRWSDGSLFLGTTFFDPVNDHGASDVHDCVALSAQSGAWVKQNCELTWGWVCEINKGIYMDGQEVPTRATPTTTNSTCGVSSIGDWFYNDRTDSCFFVSRSTDMWDNAERTCLSMNSHLATVEKDDHPFVTTILSRHNPIETLFWIGLRMTNPNLMTHNWIDGTFTSTFRAWDVDEPHPHGVQACVSMANSNGKWRDEYCQRPEGRRFVCKKSPVPIIPATTVSPALAETWGCPANFTNSIRFRDSCYYISPKNEQRNWHEAREICRSMYQHGTDMRLSSDLASIHDQLENDFLFAHMGVDKYRRWIGLHERHDRATFFWSDQTPYDFNLWAVREPQMHTQPECIRMSGDAREGGGRWDDVTCTEPGGYICKVKKDPLVQAPTVHPDSKCDPNFEYFNGACFAVLLKPSVTDSKESCQMLNNGSRLATISSFYENVFIRMLLARTQHDVPTASVRALTGGKVSNTSRLSWTSTCYPSYNNFAYYSNNEKKDVCVYMQYSGSWGTQACSDTTSHQYVVCEKRKIECAKLFTENKGKCSPGFDDECHDYCYKNTHSSAGMGVRLKATWDNAKKACTDLGGSVVTIRSEEEQKCIAKYVESSDSTIWIGLYEASGATDGNVTWKWLDEDFAFEGNYENWAPGEPSDLSFSGPDREACAEIMPNGMWNNVPCGKFVARGYICEKLKIPQSNSTCGPSELGDWVYDNQTHSCYFISDGSATWDNAEEFCNNMDAYLATVGAVGQPFVKTILSQFSTSPSPFWIGLRLVNPVSGAFAWVDGNLASFYRDWELNEPSAKGVEACVSANSATGKWKDDYCQKSNRFLCRKSGVPVIPGTTVASGLSEGWGCPASCVNCTRFRDHCYYISTPGTPADEKTWEQAEQTCRQMYQNPDDPSTNSHLASIHDQLEQDFLYAHMGVDKRNRWIGLHEDVDRRTMYWSDHTPFDFSHWALGEPNLLYGIKPECVHIYGEVTYGEGRWNDLHCDAKAGYICKMKKDPSVAAPTMQSEQRCDPNFEYLNGACFAIFEMPLQTDPDEACEHMQTGRRQHEMATSDVRALTGGKLSASSRLSWKDGCYPSYNNIEYFYTDEQNSDRCVSLKYNGKWTTEPCMNTTDHYVVCEKRLVECPKLLPTNFGKCPPGFDDECHDYCYKITHSSASGPIVPEKATWDNAKLACANLNSSILSIRTEEDQRCVGRYIESSPVTLWLGLYEATGLTNGKHVWKWLDENYVYEGNYKNWNEGEPNDMHISGQEREACSEIMANGFWNNVPCGKGQTRGYICEKLKIPDPNAVTSTVAPVSTAAPLPTLLTTVNVPTWPAIPTVAPTNPPITETLSEKPLEPASTQQPQTNSTRKPEEQPHKPTQTGVNGPVLESLGAGAIAGIVVAIFILIPASTIVGFLYWRRKVAPMSGLTARSMSYRHRGNDDRESVIQSGDDSYT